ncbi:hypothetical protein [Vibrio sp. ArtGut-C1]|uniref:hypothetical protein n=1 Tax=Vibrio sp. ArtGut-C1 TaxID=2259137 RepID=UPI0013DE8FC0|nr:hypothetical protein [Vibrio sp. ArtGut-C1]
MLTPRPNPFRCSCGFSGDPMVVRGRWSCLPSLLGVQTFHCPCRWLCASTWAQLVPLARSLPCLTFAGFQAAPGHELGEGLAAGTIRTRSRVAAR